MQVNVQVKRKRRVEYRQKEENKTGETWYEKTNDNHLAYQPTPCEKKSPLLDAEIECAVIVQDNLPRMVQYVCKEKEGDLTMKKQNLAAWLINKQTVKKEILDWTPK